MCARRNDRCEYKDGTLGYILWKIFWSLPWMKKKVILVQIAKLLYVVFSWHVAFIQPYICLWQISSIPLKCKMEFAEEVVGWFNVKGVLGLCH